MHALSSTRRCSMTIWDRLLSPACWPKHGVANVRSELIGNRTTYINMSRSRCQCGCKSMTLPLGAADVHMRTCCVGRNPCKCTHGSNIHGNMHAAA